MIRMLTGSGVAAATLGWPAAGLLLAALILVLVTLVGVACSKRLTDNAVRLLTAIRGEDSTPGRRDGEEE
jgi:hypothetical protein